MENVIVRNRDGGSVTGTSRRVRGKGLVVVVVETPFEKPRQM